MNILFVVFSVVSSFFFVSSSQARIVLVTVVPRFEKQCPPHFRECEPTSREIREAKAGKIAALSQVSNSRSLESHFFKRRSLAHSIRFCLSSTFLGTSLLQFIRPRCSESTTSRKLWFLRFNSPLYLRSLQVRSSRRVVLCETVGANAVSLWST
jgi:hypothetical protein